ncbi:MAG: hypothetical protein ABR511_11170 [Acidimicrobiales bacterium]
MSGTVEQVQVLARELADLDARRDRLMVRRDRLVARMRAEGATLRAIAEAAGLSVHAVEKILQRAADPDPDAG